ncbi:hypothetical protein GS429_09665 [Natronorubrum sp. JWXQ-INN-674]|uniref:Uncharacterized protein n=1 Tax=Natronorubrum halalkaliphilum TaxID=2691917 RepID=A0A6B0VM85_9EURY|nr:hypothetical protein [Natronorubrum halalkaliphilum]MXV62323.1 hypothetical protein [Natronorubrum halalkaliphilum]
MTDESPPVPEDVLATATERLEDEALTLADNEEILTALSELTPIYERERSYFVLGNYDREQMRRLDLVVDRLNRRSDAYAFRMSDVRGGWDNGIQKFCLISDLVSHIVGVAEKEPSGFLVEQGLVVGTEEYFEKSHVLKRTYPDTDEEHPYGWMEDSVFELLEEDGRLYQWETEAELVAAVEALP